MKNAICDQLFVNDTNYDPALIDGIISNCLPPTVKTIVISKQELQDNLRDAIGDYDGIVILPGSGGIIAQDILNLSDCSAIYLPSIKRKLAPGSMSPRGIDISENDLGILQSLQGPVCIADDVVASGTTINGLYKRLSPSAQSQCRVVTLVLRKPNELRRTSPIVCGVQVEGLGGGYPKINTLSTLQSVSSKRDFVLSGRKNIYGEKFVKEMSELFTL